MHENRLTKKDDSGKAIYINWTWPQNLPREEQFRQLFGLHLLPPNSPRSTIALVESEDAAIFLDASGKFGDVIFMATGGMSNVQRHMLEPLRGHRVLLFPDMDDDKAEERTTRWRREWGIFDEVIIPMLKLTEQRRIELFGAQLAQKADMRDYFEAMHNSKALKTAVKS